MKRTAIRTIALLALAGLIGWLIASKSGGEENASAQKSKQSGPKSVLVTTQPVQKRTLTDILSTIGTLRADESIDIKNEVPGKVVDIGFEEGDEVRRGEVLLRMRSSTLRAELEVDKQRKKLLEKQVERQRKILAKGGISQQEFDVTQNELQVLNAQLDRIRAEIERTVVRAPFSGVVGLRSVSEGAILAQGTTFATLQKLDPIELEFSVPERYARQLREGMEVRFRLHGDQTIHSAEVHAIETNLDASNRTLTARARMPNPDRALRPGSYAQVRTAVGRIEDALTVPSAALQTSADKTTVWVNVDGEAERREVETGMRTENHVQITDGVSAGEEVVTTGRQKVQPGAKLEIDDSEDAMNVEQIEPDPSRPGMRNKWFSEESLPETSTAESTADEEDDDNPSDESEGSQ